MQTHPCRPARAEPGDAATSQAGRLEWHATCSLGSHFFFQMHRLTSDLLKASASSDRADAPPSACGLESAHAV